MSEIMDVPFPLASSSPLINCIGQELGQEKCALDTSPGKLGIETVCIQDALASSSIFQYYPYHWAVPPLWRPVGCKRNSEALLSQTKIAGA
jgi:hypothetical protein